jgi:hypothetical protein
LWQHPDYGIEDSLDSHRKKSLFGEIRSAPAHTQGEIIPEPVRYHGGNHGKHADKGQAHHKPAAMALDKTMPLSETMAKQIGNQRAWARGRARPASSTPVETKGRKLAA